MTKFTAFIILLPVFLCIACDSSQKIPNDNTIISTVSSTNNVVLASEVQWTPLNAARGEQSPQAGTLWGDRNEEVATGFLVKFKEGFSSPPHIHNVTYRGVVIKGLIHNDDPNAEKMWMPAVYGCAGGLADLQGTLAEYIVADSNLIAQKPVNLSMREAAALPLVAITAYEGLTRAGVQKGQKVLVHGGAGGVGHVALQLAVHFGADVYSTCSGGKQLDLIEQLGATSINYKTEEVEAYVKKYTDGKGFDVIFDSVGGENLNKSFEAAALNAQVATTVSLCELDLSTVHFKGLSLHVVFMLIPMIHNHKREEHGEILHQLAQIIEAGGLKPVLDENRFSLEAVGKAYAHLESGKAIGKIVVEN